LERFEDESLEDQCKRLLENKELPPYFDCYAEYLLDEHYQKYVIIDEIVYYVQKEDVDTESDIFKATKNPDGNFEFEVRYYNGGCGFEEAIEEALKNT
jgi:hypothetical protein